MYFTNDYSENTWRNDADARERAENQREQIAMQKYEPEGVVLCDGSGMQAEWYVDVDQTDGIRCPGCAACAVESEIDRSTRRAPITNSFYREVA